MKKLYPSTLYAITVLCLTFFSLSAGAQVPPATYTAVLGGNWHTSGTGPGIWATAEPPMNCVSCTIILNIPTNQTVTLNTHVVLSGNSTLVIGGTVSGNPNGTTLYIPNSGATDSSHSNSVNMITDGTNNAIQVINKFSSVLIDNNPPSGAGNYDGLFSTSVTNGVVQSTKAVGYAPAGFTNGAITYTGAPQEQSITAGPVTLSATGTLPIILSSFNAVLNQGAVDLSWTTASESNSDHFSVQRSTNAGASWNEIGTVAAAGNSSLALNYSFTDNKPAKGTSEYRLQLVDRDGKYTYSDVKAISQGIVTGVSIYPNPARDFVNITLNGAAGESMLIRLFNESGALLQEKNVANAGGTTVPLAVSSYPEGNYLIVVSAADGSRQISKLLITK
ncbi:MAG TPA: T9SS type A sorting domain-containing protein [Puia sp.]|nr:T9SS type A sorting domain-containing protein [Puia sp.]